MALNVWSNPTLPVDSHIQTVERFMNLDIFKNTYYRVFGTRSDKELKRIRPLVNRINAFESEMQGLTDEALKLTPPHLKSSLRMVKL